MIINGTLTQTGNGKLSLSLHLFGTPMTDRERQGSMMVREGGLSLASALAVLGSSVKEFAGKVMIFSPEADDDEDATDIQEKEEKLLDLGDPGDDSCL